MTMGNSCCFLRAHLPCRLIRWSKILFGRAVGAAVYWRRPCWGLLSPHVNALTVQYAANTIARMAPPKSDNQQRVEVDRATCITGKLYIKPLIKLLGAEQLPWTQRQAAFALANIALGSPSDRKLILEHGGISALVDLLAPGVPATTQFRVVGALRNVVYGDDDIFTKFERCGGPEMLTELLMSKPPPEVLEEASLALYYVCCSSKRTCKVVEDKGALAKLCEHLSPAQIEKLGRSCHAG